MDTRQQYLQLLDEITDTFKETEFTLYGVDWWPVIKIQLGLYLHNRSNNQQVADFGFKSAHIPVPKTGVRDLLKYKLLSSKKRREKKDVLVISNSNHKIKIRGKTVNQFTDPFIEEFDALNVKYQMLDTCALWSDIMQHKAYLSVSLKKEFNSNDGFQQKLLELDSYISGKTKDAFSFYGLLVSSIIEIQSFYEAFLILFRKYAYQKVLLYCYYSNISFAAIRACASLNIESIEYQHSLISDYHLAYSGWTDRISNSSVFFPSKTWVWSQKEELLLKNNFSYLSGYDIVLGGNVFLSKFKLQLKEGKSDLQSSSVLVTLQGLPLPDFLCKYIEADKKHVWYIRQHPRYPLDAETMNRLKESNPEYVEINKANSLSLYELLMGVEFHLTCFSGTALEAMTLNVPNIIFGEAGYNSYKEYIEEGEFKYVTTPEELDNVFINKQTRFQSNMHIATKDLSLTVAQTFGLHS